VWCHHQSANSPSAHHRRRRGDCRALAFLRARAAMRHRVITSANRCLRIVSRTSYGTRRRAPRGGVSHSGIPVLAASQKKPDGLILIGLPSHSYLFEPAMISRGTRRPCRFRSSGSDPRRQWERNSPPPAFALRVPFGLCDAHSRG